jgi:hypothetical protein
MITSAPRINPRYTFQRNSLYYFRYTLPTDISKVVGKRGLRYSLQTGYIKHAEKKARSLAGAVEDFISEIREEPYIIMDLSKIQIQSLLDQHLRKALSDDEERRLSAGRIVCSPVPSYFPWIRMESPENKSGMISGVTSETFNLFQSMEMSVSNGELSVRANFIATSSEFSVGSIYLAKPCPILLPIGARSL